MSSLRSLPDRFRRASLDLELLRTPLSARSARGVSDLVQLDITSAARAQRFRLYPGAPENRIEVLGPDPARQQLVLFIDEPRRTFELSVPKHRLLPPGTKVLRESARERVIEQETPGRKRHFLCGMDEQHLFIAELPYGVSSTHAARDALRAPEVPSSLVLRGEKVVRQGEWFFLPLLPRQLALVEALVAKGSLTRGAGIAQAAQLRRAGRPHVADEIVVAALEGRERLEVFVRGAVRHPDHQTLVLREFRRAVPNRERFAQPEGVFWVD